MHIIGDDYLLQQGSNHDKLIQILIDGNWISTKIIRDGTKREGSREVKGKGGKGG